MPETGYSRSPKIVKGALVEPMLPAPPVPLAMTVMLRPTMLASSAVIVVP